MIRRLAVGAALVVMAACALLSLVVALPFLAVGYVVDLMRVRRRDPVDEHWLTAAAVLTPDHPDLPHAADCDCAECTYAKFAAIIRDFYEEPTR